MERQAFRRLENSGYLEQIDAELNESETKLRRFYDAMESGAIDPSEPTFKERMSAIVEKRDSAKAAKERALAELRPKSKLTNTAVKKFADFIRMQLDDGPIQFKRQYLRAVIDKIIVMEDRVDIICATAN